MTKRSMNDDPRIDPRIKALMGGLVMPESTDAASREEMLARFNTPEALAMSAGFKGFMELCDTEEIAPSKGLAVSTLEFTSEPDGNTI